MVVIVGVIIVAIAVASTSDGRKPATRDEPPPRGPAPATGPPAPVVASPPAWSPPPGPTTRAPSVAGPAHRAEPGPVADRGVLRRLRSAVLLGLAVVVLGSIAAGLVGGAVAIGVHMIRAALG